MVRAGRNLTLFVFSGNSGRMLFDYGGRAFEPGDTLEATVLRDNQEITISVTLAVPPPRPRK